MAYGSKKVGEKRYREDIGRYYEDFQVGDTYEHRPGRTISEADNTWFTLLTMNKHPVHFDANYAAKSEFGPKFKGVRHFLKAESEKLAITLRMIMAGVAAGEITEDEAKILLNQQRVATSAVLTAAKGMTAVAVQSAVDAALGVVALRAEGIAPLTPAYASHTTSGTSNGITSAAHGFENSTSGTDRRAGGEDSRGNARSISTPP